ncbi:MAG: SIMPL domain-containing protein [bacterium]|nr:SIMPL domain-containing protein [bacterium]
MDEQIKNKVGKAVIMALGVFAVSALWFVYSYSQYYQAYPQRTFSVSAEGKATGIPDVAKFTFSVITEGGTDTANIQEENTGRANSVIAFLKDSGVEDKDIKTQSYTVDPRYQYCNYNEGSVCPPPAIVGYTITNIVSVKARDFKKLGALFAGIVERGANSSDFSFAIEDPTSVENEARSEAIEKAKEKAVAVAKAGNVKLGKLLSIQEGNSYDPYYGYGMGGGAAPMVEKSSPPPVVLEPGSEEVTINVTLTYEMK